MFAFGHEAVDDQTAEMACHGSAVPILQTDDDVAGPATKRNRGQDTVGGGRRRPEERESAGSTQGRARPVAAGATSLEDHADQCDEGV